MTHLGLFEGIGGFSLAARWMGWETVAWCEWDKKCQKVLSKHFPDAKGFDDIKQTNFSEYANKIDVLTGGFPCQPFSQSGKRKGTEDDRYLWPEMLRAIREIQPVWIVGENVYGITNWSKGLVFEQVQIDLENQGYKVQSVILPACSVNAPHRRDRVWFIANSIGNRTRRENGNGSEKESITEAFNLSQGESSANSECFGQSGQGRAEGQKYTEKNGDWKASWSYADGRWPTQPPVCGRNDGVPDRMDRLKQLGNAIVPQVALQIFKVIQKMENHALRQ